MKYIVVHADDESSQKKLYIREEEDLSHIMWQLEQCESKCEVFDDNQVVCFNQNRSKFFYIPYLDYCFGDEFNKTTYGSRKMDAGILKIFRESRDVLEISNVLSEKQKESFIYFSYTSLLNQRDFLKLI